MKRLILPCAALLLGFSTASNAVSTIYDFAAEGNVKEAGYLTFYSDDHNSTTSLDATIKDIHDTATNPYEMPGGLSITASNGSGLSSGSAVFPVSVVSVLPDGTGTVTTNSTLPQGPDATATPPRPQHYAYFDGNKDGGSKKGGLGVCKESGGACGGNPDDNHMQGEFIHMIFDEVVKILSLDINGDHKAVATGANLMYSLDGGMSWSSRLIEDLVADNDTTDNLTVNWLLSNKTLDYTITPDTGQMYLSAMTVSAVPVPAAFWLFGTALIGFVGLSRRTNLS